MAMNALKTPLIKVSATGNDFILVDLISPAAAQAWIEDSKGRSRAEWTKLWCDRHFGMGADGVAFLEASPNLDFQWDFYNSDGSVAEMCGNAARAVSLYVYTQSGKAQLDFLTKSGQVSARVLTADIIEVSMMPIAEEQWAQWSSSEVTQLNYDFVRAGVPHAVMRVPDIADQDSLRALALELKREARFATSGGTNVTFVRPVSKDKIESITFERGVENFTLSCGTGAVAAAHSFLRGEEERPIEVRVPGGQLFVVWKKGRPHLRGPARIVAEIRWLTGG